VVPGGVAWGFLLARNSIMHQMAAPMIATKKTTLTQKMK